MRHFDVVVQYLVIKFKQTVKHDRLHSLVIMLDV